MLTPSSLWITAAIIQVIVALLARRSQTTPRSFKSYLYFEAVASPFAYLVWLYGSQMSYFYTFYAVAIIGDILVFLVAYEVYGCVFGPAAALPRMVPERAAISVIMAFSGATALGVFIPALTSDQLRRTMLMTEQILTAAAGSVFAILLAYSLMLRIAWPRRIAGLAFGFVLYLGIDVGAVFVRARGSHQLAAAAGEAGKTAYLLALVVWVFALWKKESAPVPATLEQIETMKMFHRESMEALARCGVDVEQK